MSSLLRSPYNQNISFFKVNSIRLLGLHPFSLLNKKLTMVFDSWVEICEDDGKTGVVI